MRYPVAVLIPTRNDEATIEAAITSAWQAGSAEVIVTDGGSSDGTIDRAREANATIVSGESIRGRQLNRAAERAASEIFLVLHADSLLSRDSLRRVVEAIASGFIFGGFRLRFTEPHPLLKIAAALINLRTAMTRCPWGDQAQFVSRAALRSTGGFREYPLMEDYELAARMKRSGRTIVLPQYVTTSGRRFLENGFVRTAALNWRIIFAYRRGADPFELEKLYRGGSSHPEREALS